MDQRQRLRSEIDLATVDLVHKVQELEERATELKSRVKENLQLDHHMEERPWVVLGLSVAAGAVLGLILR